eukprot:15454671-Alexandrium_andersonii.AAC.1
MEGEATRPCWARRTAGVRRPALCCAAAAAANNSGPTGAASFSTAAAKSLACVFRVCVPVGPCLQPGNCSRRCAACCGRC